MTDADRKMDCACHNTPVAAEVPTPDLSRRNLLLTGYREMFSACRWKIGKKCLKQ
jgi:hypothetical protein